MAKFGVIEAMHVCENLADHLLGNVFFMFASADDAARALHGVTGRHYAGRPVLAEFSNVADFHEATCRQHEMGSCARGGYCVPEEHEILTSRGFLDLDAYKAAAAADPNLLVAGYNVASKTLVFEEPELVELPADTRELVELSDANEMVHVWSAGSDSHGLKSKEEDQSNGVSMLVTKDHDVFAQVGNPHIGELLTNAISGENKDAPAKLKAITLLKSDREYNGVRQLAVAEEGVEQTEITPDFFDELGLRTTEQRALFYELYGFWLGDGTLDVCQGRKVAVQFAHVKTTDLAWLEATLMALDVPYTKGKASKVDQVEITIESDAWNRVFADEYAHKYLHGAADESADDEGADAATEDTAAGAAESTAAASAGADDEAAAKRAKTALTNLQQFASYAEVNDDHTATALWLQKMRDAVELTDEPIVAPRLLAAAAPPATDEETGRQYDVVSTAKGSYMQPEGIKSAKWFAHWVWRLGAKSLRRVLAGLHRADGTNSRALHLDFVGALPRRDCARVPDGGLHGALPLRRQGGRGARCGARPPRHRQQGQLGGVLCRAHRLGRGRKGHRPEPLQGARRDPRAHVLWTRLVL
jgi:hypothetical protein